MLSLSVGLRCRVLGADALPFLMCFFFFLSFVRFGVLTGAG